MDYRKITAIFPPTELDDLEHDLMDLGIPGMTVSRVHGFGEYHDFYSRDTMVDSVRVEVFADANQTVQIVEALKRAISRKSNCDGMIAVLPVEEFIHVRRFSGTTPG